MRLVFLLAVALIGCPLRDPVDVHPDYPPLPPFSGNVDAACEAACTNLRRLGCPEGYGAVSGETCERRCIVAMELRTMPLDCWTRADNVVLAKSCGSLRCVH